MEWLNVYRYAKRLIRRRAPLAALNVCGARVKLDRSARFAEITPLQMSDLD
jgi:hypothetical protein